MHCSGRRKPSLWSSRMQFGYLSFSVLRICRCCGGFGYLRNVTNYFFSVCLTNELCDPPLADRKWNLLLSHTLWQQLIKKDLCHRNIFPRVGNDYLVATTPPPPSSGERKHKKKGWQSKQWSTDHHCYCCCGLVNCYTSFTQVSYHFLLL